MNPYLVKKLERHEIAVNVPASKSILNRALVLSAFSGREIQLAAGPYAQDTRALIDCLLRLGVQVCPTEAGLSVCGKEIAREATLDVGSAGTVARFLTTMLAFRGGNYRFTASPQMTARPMDILAALEKAGVCFEYSGAEGHFPFRMRSAGISVSQMQLDTDTSTQYASGVLLAAAVGTAPLTLTLTGKRTFGSYIRMTVRMLQDFGARCERCEDALTVFPATNFPTRYCVESDVSAACYFYALSLLCNCRVTVYGVHRDSIQGDIRFLQLLEERGVILSDGQDGLTADGSKVTSYPGFEIDMRDFSDQSLTLAALAPFAATPTVIRGIGHSRMQECDRVEAIRTNLTALGVPCETEKDGVRIFPAPIRPGCIKTFGDHRVAMAFSLIGLRTGGITVDDPDCCKKTFENFFTILDGLNA